MVNPVRFKGIKGAYIPCNGWHQFKVGDYFRLPNGDMYHIKSENSPFEVINVIMERPFPLGTIIINVVKTR
jgi:hypothetical protein